MPRVAQKAAPTGAAFFWPIYLLPSGDVYKTISTLSGPRSLFSKSFRIQSAIPSIVRISWLCWQLYDGRKFR